MAPENKGAFLPAAQANPLSVDIVPYPTVGEDEIIVKVAAAAVNPMDWYIQIMGPQLFPWLKYPYIPGSDVAGTVEEVGPSVTRFKKGDRIVGLAAGFEPRAGGFQTYCVLLAKLSSPVPKSLDFVDAAVLPLGLSTAAAGLFQKDHLALDYPKEGAPPSGKTLLIWAGSSSVGSNAIQLAVAAGYEVFTTSSPKNFDYCKKLGAAKVFDYKSETVKKDLLEAFSGKTCGGGFAIQRGSEDIVFEVVAKSEGRKFVTCAMPVPENKPASVDAKFVFASTIKDNEVGKVIFEDFLPAALERSYQTAPPPLVVGNGLEKVQEAYEMGKSGAYSAKKLLVTL